MSDGYRLFYYAAVDAFFLTKAQEGALAKGGKVPRTVEYEDSPKDWQALLDHEEEDDGV